MEKVKSLFSVETKNGRAMRTLLQGFIGTMTAFTVLYGVPEFGAFMRTLDTATGSLIFSGGAAAIAAVISRLMPVIGAIYKALYKG